jgi:hypothetical protein
MDLQELIARARLIFNGAPQRREIFNLINGKKSAKELAIKSGRQLTNTLRDLQKLKDLELISPKITEQGGLIKKDNSIVYEQSLLLKHLPSSYFDQPEKVAATKPQKTTRTGINRLPTQISIPTTQQILDICSSGEDQLYEFKRAGTEMDKLSKEIAAFANTKAGGIVFYGVEDDGTIENSDLSRQDFDQRIQNSVKNNIAPIPVIKIIEQDILGYKIILVITPPWNRRDVYHFQDGTYIRRGTNVFKTKVDEDRKLHNGEYVI